MASCGRLASANVLEDRGDNIGIFDAGDDAQFAAALGAGLDVDGEDAFQAPHRGHGGKGLIRLFVARFAFWRDGPAMLAIRREHAVEPGEVQSRTRDQRRRAGDEVEWVEDDVGGAVAKRLLEPIDDLSPIVGREPLVGDGGPCDVALRWRIEDYFRILKSGCKVEDLQHHTAERLERAIAVKMVVGWRIQLMVRLGREVPELPSELLFSDGELRVLATFARSRELPPPERLGDAVGLVARLGGWLGRTRDPPGAQLMWHGYTQLVPMAFAFELRDEYG